MRRLGFLLVLSCGGGGSSEPPPKTTPTSTTASDAGAGASTASGGDDLMASKKAFVADCSKEEPTTDAYCGCAWDVARTAYGDDALRPKGTPSPDDLSKIHVKVASQCASLYPADVIEKMFMSGCTKKNSEMQQYCACSWAELAKKMSPGELVVERVKGTEKYQTALRASANVCGKLRPAR